MIGEITEVVEKKGATQIIEVTPSDGQPKNLEATVEKLSYMTGARVIDSIERIAANPGELTKDNVIGLFEAQEADAKARYGEMLTEQESSASTIRYYEEREAELHKAIEEIKESLPPITVRKLLDEEFRISQNSITYSKDLVAKAVTDTTISPSRVVFHKGRIERLEKEMAGFKAAMDLFNDSGKELTSEGGFISDKEFISLDALEREAYIRKVADAHHLNYEGISGRNHIFGWQPYAFEIPEHIRLRDQVTHDHNMRLSSEEEQIIQKGSTDIFKVHITVPMGKRLEVLSDMFEAHEHDDKLVRKLDEDKTARRAAGEQTTVGVTNKELREAGGRFSTIINWKMKDFKAENDHPRNADFVLYVQKEAEQTSEEALALMIMELKPILEPHNLPPITKENTPRYSLPVGESMNGVSVVQGDGDFKDYLMRAGGEEKLAQFYDAQRNYAVRTSTHLPF